MVLGDVPEDPGPRCLFAHGDIDALMKKLLTKTPYADKLCALTKNNRNKSVSEPLPHYKLQTAWNKHFKFCVYSTSWVSPSRSGNGRADRWWKHRRQHKASCTNRPDCALLLERADFA